MAGLRPGRYHGVMLVGRMCRVVSVVIFATAAAILSPLPTAAAGPCPDIEVVFARGRIEPPGTGRVGDAFYQALKAKTRKSVGLYAVDYPADTEVIQGANDPRVKKAEADQIVIALRDRNYPGGGVA